MSCEVWSVSHRSALSHRSLPCTRLILAVLLNTVRASALSSVQLCHQPCQMAQSGSEYVYMLATRETKCCGSSNGSKNGSTGGSRVIQSCRFSQKDPSCEFVSCDGPAAPCSHLETPTAGVEGHLLSSSLSQHAVASSQDQQVPQDIERAQGSRKYEARRCRVPRDLIMRRW